MSKYYSTKELADYLNVTPLTIRRKSLKGEIPSIKIGNRLRFDKDEIDTWLLNFSERRSFRVLVVDDEPFVGALIKSTLIEPDYIVTVKLTSEEALETIDDTRFDIIYLDLRLPRMDGAELFHHIRELDADVPVVIVTGYPDSTIMSKAMEYGPFTVIKKPFTPDDILKTAAYLSSRRDAEV